MDKAVDIMSSILLIIVGLFNTVIFLVGSIISFFAVLVSMGVIGFVLIALILFFGFFFVAMF